MSIFDVPRTATVRPSQARCWMLRILLEAIEVLSRIKMRVTQQTDEIFACTVHRTRQQSSISINPSHIIVLTVDTDAMLIAGAWRAPSCINMIGTRHRWRWWWWWWWWYADRGWHGCYEVITPGTRWYQAHTWSQPCKLHHEYKIIFILNGNCK